MSAIDLIRRAFEQGYTAGERDCPRSKCPYAPHTQAEKWQAWMLGYEEASPRYRARDGSGEAIETAQTGSTEGNSPVPR